MIKGLVLIILSLLLSDIAFATEATTNEEKCLIHAFTPFNNTDLGALNLGVLIWEDKANVEATTKTGTIMLNGGGCNTSSNFDIYSAIALGLKKQFALNKATLKLDNSGAFTGWANRNYDKKIRQDMRSVLHECEGLSPKLDSEISQLWGDYKTQMDTVPAGKPVEK